MTRLGKIARLPRTIREALNQRLADGEMGTRLVEWLNTLPEVRTVLEADFGGRAVNEQNLSEWKQGGFAEWQRHQMDREWARLLAEESEELAEDGGTVPVAERLAAPVALALAQLLRESAALDAEKRRAAVLGVADQLALLRRSNLQAVRLQMESERWAAHQKLARAQEEKDAARAAHWERIRKRICPGLDEDFLPMGGGDLPEDLKAAIVASQRLQNSRGASPSPEKSR